MPFSRRSFWAIRALPWFRTGFMVCIGLAWLTMLRPENNALVMAGIALLMVTDVLLAAWAFVQYTMVGGGADLWASIMTYEKLLACVILACGGYTLYRQPSRWQMIVLPVAVWAWLIYGSWRSHQKRMGELDNPNT